MNTSPLERTIDLESSIDVNGPIEAVFKHMLHHIGEGNTLPDGKSLNMFLEVWPGGRWFRDRGEGIGHLWGHVQTIKPPVLVEITGPMFMSYPALNHLEYKLEANEKGGTKVTLRHRALGFLLKEHCEGVMEGHNHWMNTLAATFKS